MGSENVQSAPHEGGITPRWRMDIFQSFNAQTLTICQPERSQRTFNLRDQGTNFFFLSQQHPFVIPFQPDILCRHIQTDQHRNLHGQNLGRLSMPLHLRLDQIQDLTDIIFRRIGMQWILLPKNLEFDQPFQYKAPVAISLPEYGGHGKVFSP